MSIGSEKNMSILLHNRYELGSILGKGGQATVFRARDTVLNVDRAIKLLSSDMMKNNDARMRFEAEAQVMAKIDHPSVVRLYDIVSSPSVLFLVMDIINGGNIWQWVRKYGPMPEKWSVWP
jgi:serine/threonine protein kinase